MSPNTVRQIHPEVEVEEPLFQSETEYQRPRGDGKKASEAFADASASHFESPLRSEDICANVCFLVHIKEDAPLEERFMNLLNRYYATAGLITVNEITGSWSTYQPKTAVSGRRSMYVPGTEAEPETVRRVHSDPLVEAIRSCKSQYLVVLNGNSQHPAERIVGMFDELRRGKELVISSDFASAYGGLASENPRGAKQLLHARKLLKKRGLDISDPFSGFYAARTASIQDLLEKVRRMSARGSGNILFDILRVSDKSVAIQQMYHAPFFSPGFISSQHLSP